MTFRHYLTTGLVLLTVAFVQVGCASPDGDSNAASVPDAGAGPADGYKPLSATDEQREVLPEIVDKLKNEHYNQIKLDEDFSETLFDAYLDELDPMHSVFLASDIDRLRDQYEHKMVKQLNEGKLTAAYDIFNTYQKRRIQISQWAEKRIKEGLDTLKADGELKTDREDEPWPEDADEREELWNKLLKNQAIELRLTHLDKDKVQKRLKQRYANELKQLRQTEEDDAFDMYMDAFTHLYDPHTDYFSPSRMQDFDIGMNLKLQGIGAELRVKHGYPELSRLVPGGPAAKSGKLKPTDRIMAVGQGKKGDFTDVIGMRLDKAVRLIRGEAGSYVRLQVTPQDGGHTRTVTLKREEIELKDQEARSHVVDIKRHGKKHPLGVLTLPSFYNGTVDDVEKQINKLKKQNVEGIVLDLRSNGGGALGESMKLLGLFMDSGPGVQIRDANGNIQVLGSKDHEATYSGPLTVMINRMSASASEIVAGALQDYGRAAVLGSQTFGKGTVQTLMPLSTGEFKITQAKFYRVSGKSTQKRGIVPDIEFPSAIDPDKIGESALDNPLPYDKVPPTAYPHSSAIEDVIPSLEKAHDKRVADDADYQYMIRSIRIARKMASRDSVSLDIDKRRDEQEGMEKRLLKLANANRKAHGKSPYEDYEAFKDAQEEKIRKQGASAGTEAQNSSPGADEGDSIDPYQRESAHILLDMIQQQKQDEQDDAA